MAENLKTPRLNFVKRSPISKKDKQKIGNLKKRVKIIQRDAQLYTAFRKRKPNNKRNKKFRKKQEKRQSKQKFVKKVTKDAAKKDNPNVVVPQSSALPVDELSLEGCIRAHLDDISVQDDVFENQSPAMIAMYLRSCFLIWINTLGNLTGENRTAVPLLSGCDNLNIPGGFALWLQGLLPFSYMGTNTTSTYQFNDNVQLVNNGYGYLNEYVSGPGYVDLPNAGLPNNHVFAQWKRNYETVYSQTPSVVEGVTSTSPPSLLQVVSNPTVMASISQALGQLEGMVALQNVPRDHAPGPEAYCRPNSTKTWIAAGVPTDPAQAEQILAPTAWFSLYPHFNPEVALLYNLGTKKIEMSTTYLKPILREIFNYRGEGYRKTYPSGTFPVTPAATVEVSVASYPWYFQPFAMLTRLGRQLKGIVDKPMMQQIQFGGKHLVSLFPRPNLVGFSKLSSVAFKEWKKCIDFKQADASTADPILGQLCNYFAICNSVLWQTINKHCICYANAPSVVIYENNIVTPNFQTVNFPQVIRTDQIVLKTFPLFAKLVSEIGAINNHGYVQVPISQWETGSLSVDAALNIITTSIPGYKNWSAYGFGINLANTENAYGAVENATTLSVGGTNAVLGTNPPNIAIGRSPQTSTTQPLSAAYLQPASSPQDVKVGWNSVIKGVYPIVPTSESLVTIHENFLKFVANNNLVTQIPMIKALIPPIGSISQLIDFDTPTESDIGTSGASQVPPNNTIPATQLTNVEVNQDEVNSGTPHNSKETMGAMLRGISQNQTKEDDPLNQTAFIRLKWNIIVNGNVVTPPPAPPVGKNTLMSAFAKNFNFGQSLQTITSSLLDDLMRPGSSYAAMITKADQTPIKNVSFVPKMGKFNLADYKLPALNVVSKLTKSALASTTGQNTQKLTSKMVGLKGLTKMLPQDVRDKIAAKIPRLQLSTQESSSGGGVLNLVKGVAEKGWNMAKGLLGSGEKDAEKGVEDVGKDGMKMVKDGISGAVKDGFKAIGDLF